jgi:hypothetical protein
MVIPMVAIRTVLSGRFGSLHRADSIDNGRYALDCYVCEYRNTDYDLIAHGVTIGQTFGCAIYIINIPKLVKCIWCWELA